MKLNTVILLFFVTIISCAQKSDCNKLKTGIFTIQTESNGIITVTRTKTQSIEDIPAIGKKMVNSINWTSDCSFTIEYKSGDKPTTPTAELPIDCEIIEVAEDYHIVRAQIRGTETQFDYKMENKKSL